MERRSYDDLAAFVVIAQERSFTRAGAKLGVSSSALSQTMRSLEERVGVRLLARTTRSVATTEAGEQLLEALGPRFSEIDDGLARLRSMAKRPAGTIRITANDHAADTIVWPALKSVLQAYPDIRVEITTEGALTDIVAERYDAGVRLGDRVEKDMVSIRISPDLRMAVVGAPSYFASRKRPRTPQELTEHECVNIRMPTSKALSIWEFEKDGREVNIRVSGRLVFNSGKLRIDAALAGMGLAYLLEDHAREHIDAGRLVRVLSDWCQPFPGYHLYYPTRRQQSPAFALVVDALRRSR